MKNKYGLLKILLVLLVFVIAGVVYSCVSSDPSAEAGITEPESDEQTETVLIPDREAETQKLLCVHVCGCVREPGVYYLPEDARVHQAVEMAGGFTEEADESTVNLADPVTDGGQIYIPSEEEVRNGSFKSSGRDKAGDTDSLVNINTAGVKELTTLTGIGESKAEAIIAYRENVSAFESTEDIINVSGIGESVYEKIRDSIKVK